MHALKHRPKHVNVAVSSNRYLEPSIHEKAVEIFRHPTFQNKQVLHNWRFFVKAGKAATGPPVGQEFSKVGLKIMDFTKAFNDRTKPVFKDDIELLVRIQVYFDKSYIYRIEPPPTAWFLMRAVRKKRRDTGKVNEKGRWSALITLEMIYEIAKMKQFNWSQPEHVPIEDRVRMIGVQARRMGIAIVGVDCPNAPVKGKTERQYDEECRKYRAEQMKLYEEFSQKQLEAAPLIERLHNPDMTKLSAEQLEQGLLDPRLFHALWTATSPHNQINKDARDRERAMKYINARGWIKDMTPDEMRTVFQNWALPQEERESRLGAQPQEPYWGRD